MHASEPNLLSENVLSQSHLYLYLSHWTFLLWVQLVICLTFFAF